MGAELLCFLTNKNIIGALKTTECNPWGEYNYIRKSLGGVEMTQTVYADLLFLVNFSMDLLCFYVTARLFHRKIRLLRMLLASSLGGVYSVAVLFINVTSLGATALDLSMCALMCLLAFGIKDSGAFGYFMSCAVYFGVSVGTGGLMTAMYSLLNRMDLPLDQLGNNGYDISVWGFAVLAIVSAIATSLGGKFIKSVSNSTVSKVIVEYQGRAAVVNGMEDTGNLLTDPISGKPIIVIDVKSAARLLGEDCAQMAARGDVSNVIGMRGDHKIRVVPINTASGSSMLCAFVPDRIIINVISDGSRTKERSIEVDALFAPSKLDFDVNKKAFGCGALVPTSLIS